MGGIIDQSDSCKLWWKRANLHHKLEDLKRRSKNEDLIYVIEYLEKRAIPKKEVPEINWDRVHNDSNPERFVPPEILYPSVQKLRDKMTRIEKENQEKIARGEKLEMDD